MIFYLYKINETIEAEVKKEEPPESKTRNKNLLKSIFSHLDKAKLRLEHDSTKVANLYLILYNKKINKQQETIISITEHMKSSINEMKEKEKNELEEKKSEILEKQKELESRILEVEKEIFVLNNI